MTYISKSKEDFLIKMKYVMEAHPKMSILNAFNNAYYTIDCEHEFTESLENWYLYDDVVSECKLCWFKKRKPI